MTIHALSALMVSDPRVVGAALAELLAAPDATRAVRRTPPQNIPHLTFASGGPCPDSASPLDRVELALNLIGDRTCAMASDVWGLPERAVAARLRSGLRMLFAPCSDEAVHTLPGQRPADGAARRRGGRNAVAAG